MLTCLPGTCGMHNAQNLLLLSPVRPELAKFLFDQEHVEYSDMLSVLINTVQQRSLAPVQHHQITCVIAAALPSRPNEHACLRTASAPFHKMCKACHCQSCLPLCLPLPSQLAHLLTVIHFVHNSFMRVLGRLSRPSQVRTEAINCRQSPVSSWHIC